MKVNDAGGSRKRSGAADWFRRARDWNPCARVEIDFQMHTTWSDGSSSVAGMIRHANRKRLGAIAITEHVNEESAWYRDFVGEVKALREFSRGTAIYHGAEIAARDYNGGLKVDGRAIDAEFLLGVVHRYPKREGGFWGFDELQVQDAVELELRALEGLAANPDIDAIGHPGGTAFKKYGPFPVRWLETAFCAARDNGIAVELNTKYLWDFPAWCSLLWRVNPVLSFGSDAHHARELGVDFGRYLNAGLLQEQGGSN